MKFFIILLLLILLIILLFKIYNFHWTRRRKWPSGPKPWLLFGNFWQLLRAKPPGYELNLEWRKKYGPVFTYWMLEMPIVIVADYSSIYNSFIKQGDAYVDRFNFNEITQIFRGGNFGIVTSDGPLWKEQRRFTLNVLKHFGVGRNLMEEKILEEISHLLKNLNKQNFNGVDEINMIENFDICIGSIISSLLFGFRYDRERIDEYFQLKYMLSAHLRMVASPLTTMLIMKPSFFKWIPGLSKIFHELIANRDQMFGYFDAQIFEHENRLKEKCAKNKGNLPVGEPFDFIETYLLEIRKRQHRIEKGSTPQFDDEFYCLPQLRNIVLDIFIAGQETTSLTLSWSLLYILHHPKVQADIHKELDKFFQSSYTSKVDSSKIIITYSDRLKLPFLCAVINESQRLANLLPRNLLHKTTRDVQINGLNIPKNTCIIPEISCVLYDETVFPRPFSFEPQRFLDENGELKKFDEFIPFSVGKRACIGEQLARMELFLIMANLLNNFQFNVIDENNLPSLEKKSGLTVQPHEFKCKISQRTVVRDP